MKGGREWKGKGDKAIEISGLATVNEAVLLAV